jgi:hypothetical protein
VCYGAPDALPRRRSAGAHRRACSSVMFTVPRPTPVRVGAARWCRVAGGGADSAPAPAIAITTPAASTGLHDSPTRCHAADGVLWLDDRGIAPRAADSTRRPR